MKTKTLKKRWVVKAGDEIEKGVVAVAVGTKSAPVLAILEPHDLAMFIINAHEMSGLRRAIGNADADNTSLWDRAAEKYGFERRPYAQSLNLKTGEITKAF
jgi:hypothetical protein